MEQDAVLKKHSTVGEALSIARRMKTRAVVLTHFSQRYPRIPPLDMQVGPPSIEGTLDRSTTYDFPIVFAFDMMRLSPSTIATAAKLTPALRALYPDETVKEASTIAAQDVLSIPGLFAQQELL
mmetsp:Transcript_3785/g.6469  ORF Transcript_3785/g.6469 Transcript_3785/m.6469 type:complete len:124 (-) Transcript_3785:92-463(-)